MKKRIILTLLPLLALASCGESGATTLYGKTFRSDTNEIFYSLDTTYQGDSKPFKEILKEKITGGKVDWTNSGNCDDSGKQLTGPFTPTTSYDSLISEFETRAKQAFGDKYNNISIVVGSNKDGKAEGSITKGGVTKQVVYKQYDTSTSEPTFLYIYDPSDLNNSIGKIDGGCEGGGCYNGVWKCVYIEYDGNISRTNYRFKFTDVESMYKISVYAKIAN